MAAKEKTERLGWKISKREKVAYILGRVGIYGEQALIPGMMNTFLLFNGISLTSVAIFTLLVKIVDALDDLLFGFLVDKIDLKKSKFLTKIAGSGRYMPWIRVFIWIFPLAVVLFFIMPSALSETGKIAWFTVTYLLYDFTYTLVDVPTQSLTMTITDVPEERNHLLTLGIIIITGVMYAMTMLQTVLIGEKVGMSVASVGVILAVIYAVCMVPFTARVREHNSEMKNVDEEKSQENYTIREMFRAIKSNKPYLFLELSGLVRAVATTGTAVSLFVSYYLYGSATAMVIPGLVAMIAGVAAQMLAPKICEKFGNLNVCIFCVTIVGLGGVLLYFAGWANFALVVIYTILVGIFNSLQTMAGTYMILQTIDYGKYKNGRDTTGIFNSINTLLGKVAPSLASSLGLVILGACGWVTVNAESFADLAAQNVLQPASALRGLWSLNMLIPSAGSILSGLILLFFYHLSDKDAKLMSACMAGELSVEECEAQLSRKVK
jgi:Na+/melibiose symporter-like transporter